MTKLNNSLLLEDMDRKIQNEGIKIVDIMAYAGFSVNTYYRIKNGRCIYNSTLEFICNWLGKDVKRYLK